MSNASIKISVKKLPQPKLPPTKAVSLPNVQGIAPRHLEVRTAKPAVVLRRRKPVEAIRKQAEAKRERKLARKAEAVELYQQGLSNVEIAEKMHLAASTIRAYTHEIRMQTLEENSLDEQVAELYRAGASYDDIAADLGVSRSHIGSIIKRLHKERKVMRRRRPCARPY